MEALSSKNELLARYQRAERLEHGDDMTGEMVRNAHLYPNWIGQGPCFWYVQTIREGRVFRLRDCRAETNEVAFDHERLAAALTNFAAREINSAKLPIAIENLELAPRRVFFKAFNKRFRYDDESGLCEELTTQGFAPSPDGRLDVFYKDANIWLREQESGETRQLSTDGTNHYAYGTLPERFALPPGPGVEAALPIGGAWSPDSRYFVSYRTDERAVQSWPFITYAPADHSHRPVCENRKNAQPGDEHITCYELFVVDTQDGSVLFADHPPLLDAFIFPTAFSHNRFWWSADSTKAFFIDADIHMKCARVMEWDVSANKTRLLFEEHSDTYIDMSFEAENPALHWMIPQTNELLWWSERSGWGHLYLYDLETGKLKHPVTEGDWIVQDILHYNAETRVVLLQATGRIKDRNPYYREILEVGVDTGEIRVVLSGDFDCLSLKQGTMLDRSAQGSKKASPALNGASPDGTYVVVTQTRVDTVPATYAINRETGHKSLVEETDVCDLPDNWVWPELVSAKADDGETDIYGVLFKPSDFDPSKSYPVIDIACTNPFYAIAPHGAFGTDSFRGFYAMPAAALAELGFIVSMVDGRGSCFRSKAFHDHAYGRLEKASDLSDHIAALRQWACDRPYMDLARVGIVDWGSSNGPVHGLLSHGDFYKVGALSAVRTAPLLSPTNIYHGPDPQKSVLCSDEDIAGFDGKLLLIQGMLDHECHPAGAFQLVERFVNANKDIDLVMLPTGGHATQTCHYGTRRIWDYFVRHLLGMEPVKGFCLMNGREYLTQTLKDLH